MGWNGNTYVKYNNRKIVLYLSKCTYSSYFEVFILSVHIWMLTHVRSVQHSVWAKHLVYCPVTFVQIVEKWLTAAHIMALSVFFHKCFQCNIMNLRRPRQKATWTREPVDRERHVYSYSSVNIRTSCCAAPQPAAESLFGLSQVWFCRSPPATEQSRGCSPPNEEISTEQKQVIMSSLQGGSWPEYHSQVLCVTVKHWMLYTF